MKQHPPDSIHMRRKEPDVTLPGHPLNSSLVIVCEEVTAQEQGAVQVPSICTLTSMWAPSEAQVLSLS